MKTIINNTKSEIVEKRSKFIGNLCYVNSVQEAENKIKELKKQYNDARHNCFAYRVCEEQNKIIEKASDDGEPSGTAGAPMLNLLSKSELTNCLVVVTRYFGGILLGTGGLVRAYTESAKQAIEKAQIIQITFGEEILVTITYDKLAEFKYYCQKNNINIVNIQYNENIICKIHTITQEKEKLMQKEIKKQFNIQDIKKTKDVYIKNNA